MYDEIKYEVDGPSAVITLNRPEALNALTNNMMGELKHALAKAEEDESVVGIILTGEGRGF
ncbi:MAG: enoyl-CoA hydratase-related protein, partial [Gammaproteobacteria bacterium]|nr:enoyl-CoA hydratase-related protein [Gammaproteobacteria bacterium]